MEPASTPPEPNRQPGRSRWLAGAFTPTFTATLRVAVPIVALALSINRDPAWMAQRQQLGAEAYNVGRALADGRGFSDPFGEATGPTAWVPPLFPALLSLLIRLFSGRHAVSLAVMALKVTALIAVAATAYHLARRYRQRLAPSLVVAFYLLWIVAFHYWYFVITSDIWLGSLLAVALLLGVADVFSTQRIRAGWWGGLTGLAALASPAMGMAGICVLAWLFIRRVQRRQCVVAGGLAAAIVLVWVCRNAVVFGAFVPVKSNLAFEAQLAYVVDDDGIYDPASLSRHPYGDSQIRFEYARLGEQRFVAAAGARFKEYCQHHRGECLRKLKNRALAATGILFQARLGEPPWTIWLQRIIYPVPFLGLLLGLVVGKRERRLFGLLAIVCGCYLLPYVLVAFYLRYVLALSPVLMLAAFLGIDRLVAHWQPSK